MTTFIDWLNIFYDTFDPDGHPATDGGPDFVCKRCGQRVGYVTKHAAERHGDNVKVMPVTNDNPKLAEAY